MINTKVNGILAYTTRELRNYGLYKPYSLYKFLFTATDIALLNSGAIKLFPDFMCKFYVSSPSILAGKKYEFGEEIDVKKLDRKVLMTLLKTGIVKCVFADEFASLPEDELMKDIRLYELVGTSFKKASVQLGLNFEDVKEKFNLSGKGSNSTKIKCTDIQLLKEMIVDEVNV